MMKRMIRRSYELDEREVCEAIVAWLKAQDLPTPQYIATAGRTTWTHQPLDVKIEWEEEIEPT